MVWQRAEANDSLEKLQLEKAVTSKKMNDNENVSITHRKFKHQRRVMKSVLEVSMLEAGELFSRKRTGAVKQGNIQEESFSGVVTDAVDADARLTMPLLDTESYLHLAAAVSAGSL